MPHDRYIVVPNGKPLKSTNKHRRACPATPGTWNFLCLPSRSRQREDLDDLRMRHIDLATQWDAFFILPRLPSKTGGAPVIAELLQHYLNTRRSWIRTLGTLSSISGSRCSAQLL